MRAARAGARRCLVGARLHHRDALGRDAAMAASQSRGGRAGDDDAGEQPEQAALRSASRARRVRPRRGRSPATPGGGSARPSRRAAIASARSSNAASARPSMIGSRSSAGHGTKAARRRRGRHRRPADSCPASAIAFGRMPVRAQARPAWRGRTRSRRRRASSGAGTSSEHRASGRSVLHRRPRPAGSRAAATSAMAQRAAVRAERPVAAGAGEQPMDVQRHEFGGGVLPGERGHLVEVAVVEGVEHAAQFASWPGRYRSAGSARRAGRTERPLRPRRWRRAAAAPGRTRRRGSCARS